MLTNMHFIMGGIYDNVKKITRVLQKEFKSNYELETTSSNKKKSKKSKKSKKKEFLNDNKSEYTDALIRKIVGSTAFCSKEHKNQLLLWDLRGDIDKDVQIFMQPFINSIIFV